MLGALAALRPRALRRTAAVLVVGVAVLATQGGVAHAAAFTPLTTEGFTGATVGPEWRLPSSATNTACLTASTDTAATPVKGCNLATPDPVGSGTLRLTGNGAGQVGTIYNTTSLPTSKGVDVTFNTYQWSGTNPGADGIAFILAATDPTNPAPPSTRGPSGGSLGYSPTAGSAAGTSYGYLGFGLDVFGNFQSSAFGGTDCPASSRTASPFQQAHRPRPGQQLPRLLHPHPGGAQRVARRPHRDLPAGPRAGRGGAEPGRRDDDRLRHRGGRELLHPEGDLARRHPQTISGSLPTAARLSALGFPASWFDPTTGLPYHHLRLGGLDRRLVRDPRDQHADLAHRRRQACPSTPSTSPTTRTAAWSAATGAPRW
ncbi:hypothetical protein GCM10025868_12810 [Angustibacter aerolatus]|uniref:Uncharacterized protein n=1 Tax=Angustibacter aerolatus TaxID=1162965 RepID=A0ABQ6JGY3_9ACTN|nr:hypothetical protein [Angustibacter aerolatus]GMA86031.1 hypothetical protein GCM10025868_12810 [Angustibacter aerolatus]